jgi:hypothetical protein
MALVLADRVKETTASTGAGNIILDGASTGFQSFAVIGNNNTTYYTIAGGTQWEVGIGTYTTSGPTLTRTTVLANSSGTQPTAINFSGGTKDVFVTYPAGKSVDQNGTVLYTYALYTANTTVAAGAGVLANTTSGAFTITLPASPATGNQVLIVDSASTFGTNNLTVGRNGSTISGIADDLALDISGITVTLVYNGSTWTVYSQIGASSGLAVTVDGVQTLTNKTLTAPVISTIVNTGTLTLPSSTDTLVGRATTDTLTNKTLTAPVISTISNTGTLTLPTSTDTLVGRATTDTLTNKTLTNPTVTNYVESVVVIGTVTTASTIVLTSGTVQTATLTASTACTFTMPTATAGKSFVLLLKQAAATGNGTATFTGVKFGTAGAPTITATAGKMDILSFIADGTNWYGSITQGYTP